MSNDKQRTEEWYAARAGKPTASKFSILMAKRGLGATAVTYAREIVSDMLVHTREESYITNAMQDGIDNEQFAVQLYEVETLNTVKLEGFVSKVIKIDTGGYNKEIEIGCSPDGLIDDDGGLEIKCPQQAKHMSNLLATECPAEYYDQIQGCLLVTGRKWWDFVSYNPNFKVGYQIKIIRVFPDDKWRYDFKQRLPKFMDIVDDFKNKLNVE